MEMDFNIFKKGRIGFVSYNIVDVLGNEKTIQFEVQEIKKGGEFSKIKILSVTGLDTTIPAIIETNKIKWLD